MAKPLPFSRNPQAARARRAKALLLPMKREAVDGLSLQVHIALDAMRRGRGCAGAAQILTQAMIVSGFIAEAGYGSATFEQMRSAEQAISAAFDRGRDTGVWMLDEDAFAQFAAIATTYDYQLQRAPLSAIAQASDRLDRFRAGESTDRSPRRQAQSALAVSLPSGLY